MTKSELVNEKAKACPQEEIQECKKCDGESAINNIIVENKENVDENKAEFAEIESIKLPWEPVLSLKSCENLKIQEKRKQYRKDSFGMLPDELSEEDKLAYEDAVIDAKAFNKEIEVKEISKGIFEKRYNNFIETSMTLYDGLIFEQLTKEQKEKVEKFETVMNLIKELNLEAIVTPIFDIVDEVRIKKIEDKKEEIIEEKNIQEINENIEADIAPEQNTEIVEEIKEEIIEEVKEEIKPEEKIEDKKEETKEEEIDLSEGLKILESDKDDDLIIDDSQETDLEKYLQLSDEESSKEAK